MDHCCICNEKFKFPVNVKWVSDKKTYAHTACVRKEAGWWATIKWIFRGCPKW